MKVSTQRKMFPNKDLRVVLSNDKKVSRNYFAWNVLNHSQRDLWLPVYTKALQDLLGTKYQKKAKSLFVKLVSDCTLHKMPPEVVEQATKAAAVFKKAIKGGKGVAIKEKAMDVLKSLEVPVSEYRAKSQDCKFVAEIKSVLHQIAKHDPKIEGLRRALLETKDLSYDPGRIVSVPGCQKALLVPHPHTQKHVGLYLQTAFEQNARVLISLCSAYEHSEVIPFWEGGVVQDAQGLDIQCIKQSERVLYQAERVAVIHNEKRAEAALAQGGINPETYFPRIVERHLTLVRGNQQHETVHLHYENWPDHQEAPDIEALEVLLDRKDALTTPDDLIMLNCKATIGRSGVLYFSDCGRKKVEGMANLGISFDEMKLNFAEMVHHVRNFRPILSGNPRQMRQALEVIARHYERLQIARAQ